MNRLPRRAHLFGAVVGFVGVVTIRHDGILTLLAAGLLVVEVWLWAQRRDEP